MQDACRKGDLRAVSELLNNDPELVHERDNIGTTPLHRAAAGGFLEICTVLLEHKADVNAVDKYNDTPLKKAAYRGNVNIVVHLSLHGADMNHPDGSGKLPLHHSAERGQLQSVEVMLDARADVGRVSNEIMTPLHLAATNGHSWCCKALIVSRAYIDERGGQQKMTALHMATERGHVHTARLLIAERADLNIPDAQRRLPIEMCRNDEMRRVFQSPFTKGLCHAPSCTAEGPGVQRQPRADDSCMFFVQPRDRYGIMLNDNDGFLDFTVDIEDVDFGIRVPAKVMPSPATNNHICYFDGSRIGNYKIHIFLEDSKSETDFGPGRRVPIAGSPYSISILAATLDAYTTRVTGEGAARVIVGEKAIFTIHGRDRFQNPCPGGALYVRLAPPDQPPKALDVVDSQQGEYLVSYEAPTRAGVYQLKVMLEGNRHVYNSPFHLFVRHGPVSIPHCTTSGRGLIKGGKNLPMAFTIVTRDRYGNRVSTGGVKWNLLVQECKGASQEEEEADGAGGGRQEVPMELAGDVVGFGEPIESEVIDHGNGMYTCVFTPSRVGRMRIRLVARGKKNDVEEAPKSPWFPLVTDILDWDREEVAAFIEKIGFPEHSRNFYLKDVDGMRLLGLTNLSLESEIGIQDKWQQRIILHKIAEESSCRAQPDGVTQLDSTVITQLGMHDKKVLERALRIVQVSINSTSEGAESMSMFQNKFKQYLSESGRSLQESLRTRIEDLIAVKSDALLEDWNAGRCTSYKSISDALKELETELLNSIHIQTRTALTLDTTQDAEGIAPANDVDPSCNLEDHKENFWTDLTFAPLWRPENDSDSEDMEDMEFL